MFLVPLRAWDVACMGQVDFRAGSNLPQKPEPFLRAVHEDSIGELLTSIVTQMARRDFTQCSGEGVSSPKIEILAGPTRHGQHNLALRKRVVTKRRTFVVAPA